MKKIEIRPRGEGVRMVVTSLFSYFKNEPDIMTVPEAAKALRCGKNTIVYLYIVFEFILNYANLNLS